MNTLLNALRAAAEPTRLRLLALCGEAELTVTELTQILGQSQPRVSRHLKVLCEAGLLDRNREGTWAFYRLADGGEPGGLARTLSALIPRQDTEITRDLERLETVKKARAEVAAAYFGANAARWDEIRSLYVPETDVEAAILAIFSEDDIGEFLDIGTGTGRMLELFADRFDRGVGIDLSHDMLAIARANIERFGYSHCQVRHGDMYHLPLTGGSMDAVTFHQVLHFASSPAAGIAEAARVMRPGAKLAVVDFAPHTLEFLRDEHAHRRLGFSDSEVVEWFEEACLAPGDVVRLEGEPLTVVVWIAAKMDDEERQAAE